jgi:dihydrodiol dehydrogenase / D-xylose 1-dehydrogenase (NADP)
VAVAARKLEDAEAFAAAHQIPKAYGGDGAYLELCNDPNVDICYVGTITTLHKTHALMAIAGGKHVLCEKPLASNSAEAQDMFAAAEAKGVMLQEGMWTRFFPAVEHARAAVAAGEIGDVHFAQSNFPDRCYAVQHAPMVFGTSEPPVVVAAGWRAGAATVRYGNRGIATMVMTLDEFDERFEIVGTAGRITLEAPAHCPTKMTITRDDNETEIVEYPLHDYTFLGGYPQCNQHGFFYEVEAMHRILGNGLRECPQHTKADTLQGMAIIDAIAGQVGGCVHGGPWGDFLTKK